MAYRGSRINYPITHITAAISRSQHKSWGFVICRITYSDQSKWDKFIAELQRQVSEWINEKDDEPGGAELEQCLEWTVLEEEQKLNGATMLEASRYFLQWVEDQGGPFEDDEALRYRLFIYGNLESVESIIDPARKKDFDNWNFFCLVFAERCKEINEAPMHDDSWIRVRVWSFVVIYGALMDWNTWWIKQGLHPMVVDV